MSLVEPSPPTPLTPVEIGAWLALFVALATSRGLVAPHELFEWDSANYALALTDYDVFEHRPHAPGYPLFTALVARAASLALPLWAAFVAVNAALGALTLAALGSLGATGAPGSSRCVATGARLWRLPAVLDARGRVHRLRRGGRELGGHRGACGLRASRSR